jgi:hypothetical protein
MSSLWLIASSSSSSSSESLAPSWYSRVAVFLGGRSALPLPFLLEGELMSEIYGDGG